MRRLDRRRVAPRALRVAQLVDRVGRRAPSAISCRITARSAAAPDAALGRRRGHARRRRRDAPLAECRFGEPAVVGVQVVGGDQREAVVGPRRLLEPIVRAGRPVQPAGRIVGAREAPPPARTPRTASSIAAVAVGPPAESSTPRAARDGPAGTSRASRAKRASALVVVVGDGCSASPGCSALLPPSSAGRRSRAPRPARTYSASIAELAHSDSVEEERLALPRRPPDHGSSAVAHGAVRLR